MIAIRERIEPTGLNLEEKIIDIWRCATVVKGGRRFSFAAMVVVGNGAGVVGLGYGKAREVPQAIEKAVKDARKNLVRVPIYGATIPHEVRGGYATAEVVLIPALPGTGIIAGQVTRSVLECLGIHDVLTKSVGGCNNPKNLAKATVDAVLRLRSRESVAKLRGVEIAEDPMLAQCLKVTVTPRRREWEAERGERGDRGERGRGRGRGRQGDNRGGEAPAASVEAAKPESSESAPGAAPAPAAPSAGETPPAQ